MFSECHIQLFPYIINIILRVDVPSLFFSRSLKKCVLEKCVLY